MVDQHANLRRRTRTACDVCKTRKRKCNGQTPCHSCLRYEYICTYTIATTKTSSRRVTANPTSHTSDLLPPRSRVSHDVPQSNQNNASSPTATEPAGAPPTHQIEHQPSNVQPESGAFLLRHLNSQLGGGGHNESPVQALGWNLDLAAKPTTAHTHRTAGGVHTIVSHSAWQFRFDLFVQHVHVLFGFLDVDTVREKAAQRWCDEPLSSVQYDHVLAGVAAIGSLFDPRRHVDSELQLAACALNTCQCICSSTMPSVEDVEGWLLRTLYLRFTAQPSPVWLASSTTMHLLEAAGMLTESDSSVAHSIIVDESTERSRRVFWLATLLNKWISNEWGRSATTLTTTAPRPLPQSRPNDHTMHLLRLFDISQLLDREKDASCADLEGALVQVEEQPESRFDPLTLSKANLTFAIYRRLRAKNPHQHEKTIERVIRLGRLGLEASSRLIYRRHPWWHTANVPFQFACIALTMDVPDALQELPKVVSVLEQAVSCFDTATPRKALETVRALVRRKHAKKLLQLDLLAQCIKDGGDVAQEADHSVQMSADNSNSLAAQNSFRVDDDLDAFLAMTDFNWNLFPALADVEVN